MRAVSERWQRTRRLRLWGLAAAAAVVLGGCASSPEAARVQGERGADPGNHGNPLMLIAPPERIDRVYYDDPYDDYNLHADYNLPYNPPATSEDTPQP